MAKGIRFLPVLLALGLPFTGVTQTAKPPSQPKASAQAAKPSPSASPAKRSAAASQAQSAPAGKAPASSAKTSPPSAQKAPAKAKTAQATASKAAPKTAAKAPAKTAAKSKAHTTAAKRRTPARPAIQQQPTPERYREIQQALIDRGFLQGEPTGKWDSDSVEALRRFQADQQLTPTGKIDALSLIRLGLGPKRQNLAANPLPAPSSESESQP